MTRALSVVLVLASGQALAGSTVAPAPQGRSSPRILVFTKTAGFRHSSIPVAVRAVRDLAARSGLVVDATEDSTAFSDAGLARYDAVVFLLTTGDVLNDDQQNALQRFIRRGGGFVGVHSAADTEYDWPWYGGLLGAYLRSHPHVQPSSIDVEDARHPSTVGLPRRWTRTDEWYNFARSPRRAVRVLATLDETSYSPGSGAMGADHPIAWSHRYQGGRAWYTGGGYTEESYAEPLFRKHLLGGIRYTAGLTPPRIVSVSSTLRNRRLVVSIRYASCRPCAGQLQVRLRGRLSRTRISLGAAGGRVTGPKLPRGRRRFSVVLEDRPTGLKDAVSRWVRVR